MLGGQESGQGVSLPPAWDWPCPCPCPGRQPPVSPLLPAASRALPPRTPPTPLTGFRAGWGLWRLMLSCGQGGPGQGEHRHQEAVGITGPRGAQSRWGLTSCLQGQSAFTEPPRVFPKAPFMPKGLLLFLQALTRVRGGQPWPGGQFGNFSSSCFFRSWVSPGRVVSHALFPNSRWPTQGPAQRRGPVNAC